jgi:acetyl-CoA acetyltransferase family protein
MGKMGGGLANIEADNLGAHAVRELIAKNNFDVRLIDEVIFGNVGGPAHAMNIARVIAMKAGIPKHVPAMTVHRNCASGMESITTAAARINVGEGSVYIAGGAESMSNIPFVFNKKGKAFFTGLGMARSTGDKLKALSQFRLSAFKPVIGLELGLNDIIAGMNMGHTAEVLAKEFKITRAEQDEFACRSHNLAEAAQAKLAEEIAPIVANPEKGKVISDDEGIRKGQSVEALGKLKPYFDRKHGTVTAGNSSQITDGAAAVILMSEEKAKELGLKPLGYLKEYAYAGLDPHRMGLGPVYATKRLFEKSGAKLSDIDLIELNEAFATQVIACERGFMLEGIGQINRDILNVNGGAIALGHPVGMSGTRIIITLLKELRRRNKNTGLAALCIGGGQGAAVMVEVD